jgi:DNA (cytosine-5)-methyltransferase 1
MKYGSVCSGIEAASVAWHHLGWEAQWFSEIEHFPSEVLKYRFPTVENLGDMTKLTTNETFKASTIDLLVGGTPCQSFSVAGLRGGLADPRGNLMLTFLSLADAKKPRWIVWENVPGVLSSNGGKDFGTFLGALGELGYGFAFRILNAEHFGIPQRRRRVFVVGYLGDWRVAAAVLFERESLQRDIKPSRKKRQEVAPDAEGSVGESGSWWDGSQVAGTLTKQNANGAQRMPDKDNFGAILQPTIIDRAAFNQGENAQYEPRIEEGETTSSLVAKGPHAVAQPIPVTITFNDANGRRADRPNGGLYVTEEPQSTSALTCGGNDTKVMQPIAFKVRGGCEGGGKGYLGQEERAFTISAAQDQQIAQPIAVDTYNYTTNDHTTQTIRTNTSTEHIGAVLQTKSAGFLPTQGSAAKGIGYSEEMAPTLRAGCDSYGVHTPQMAIRRLTPKECERLQGFPDDWTQIPYRNKPADQCPDGPRYKACGNSMAVPVMRWIGERIQLIDTIVNG